MKKATQGRLTWLRLLSAVLSVSFCVGCNSGPSLTLPREMEGVWTTYDPRFQGRFMELSPSFVIIVTGHDDPASVQFVDKVESATPGDLSSLTVYSTDYSEGAHYQMNCSSLPRMGARYVSKIRAWYGGVGATGLTDYSVSRPQGRSFRIQPFRTTAPWSAPAEWSSHSP